MYKIIFFLLNLTLFYSFAQDHNANLLIHSHNDYLQPIPFWTALSAGAHVVEADVFVHNNTLKVAHTKDEIGNLTLIKGYLEPMKVAAQKGYFKEPFVLMIDVKEQPYKTLKVLLKELKSFKTLTDNKNIQFLISGKRPKPEDFNAYPAYVQFDWQELDTPLSPQQLKKVGMVSVGFKEYSVWNGKGRLTHEDEHVVKEVIIKAKKLGKPFRFWGTPDNKTAWLEFQKIGVEVINTDNPYQCVAFFKKLAKHTYHPRPVQKVYQPTFKPDNHKVAAKNIILMIGDGMGNTQVSSAALANRGNLSLTQLKQTGLVKTSSADALCTDSAAGGTAMATGHKTNNRYIGKSTEAENLPSIAEILQNQQFKTGIITTDELVGATPASFYAHQKDRGMQKEIAQDFIKSELDWTAGGGEKHFKFTNHGGEQFNPERKKKVSVFFSEGGVKAVKEGRGPLLATTTKDALSYLSKDSKPFFIMVEAAKIDSYGHGNDITGVITETLDFDLAIAEALKFADSNKETLVIITADHETGGLDIIGGDVATGEIMVDFASDDHTAAMVPLFAYGPRSGLFSGVYENTEIFHKILQALKIAN
ncbi:alkaline phosphatase [Flavobacterium sp. ASW18X]|uniref:alkaline phosphatase n=1 Tax=Flavobacterium sp. ASW18X TaxID=2572595 RepID=UPI0010AE32FC|nr:alkaline phosphatase [Flavobacterium sp. ASW18X]TKD66976.1 alkaline phosphatase [Flavobacterium sp. ASW18X]